MKNFLMPIAVIAFLALAAGSASAQIKSADTVYSNFLTPPNAAQPRVWWHWMNGNITKEGIKLDLLWMKRSGIGGFQNFDAALLTPQIVKKRLIFMTPEWKDAFGFTTRLADSLHLEMAIAGSPGWSESGGPWVPAENGMKKIVWTETLIAGGKPFTGTLLKAPEVTGPFQNLPLSTSDLGGMGAAPAAPPQNGHDIAVIACKIPEGDIPLSELNPVITSSGGTFTLKQLTDGDLATASPLPPDTAKGYAWIQFNFKNPQTIKAVTIVGGGDKGPFGLYGELTENRAIEISDDGVTFTRIAFIPAGGVLQQTIDIPPTTSKYFRVTFKNLPAMDLMAMFGMGNSGKPKSPPPTPVAELILHTANMVDRFEEKAAFATATDLYQHPTPAGGDAIQTSDVIDLTGKMDADGTLHWTPPAGWWSILRFGYSLTGITNHPATPEATGLEVDKLDPVAVRAYFEHYLDLYKDASGGLMGTKGGLQWMVTDSWEALTQNWTPKLFAEFEKRRGYSMLPWMPVLSGRIVKSSQASDAFLWDLRKTLSELVAENHYDLLTTILHERGMKRYSESQEDGRAFIADGMEVKRKADIPMSAMWTPSVMGDGLKYRSDIRESASVAHIYGQNIVAAESLTAFGLGGNAWSYYPEKLKPTADMELASGLNRFVIHTSVHQPTDDKLPGLGLGPFGQWFNRHDTWAEDAKAWTSYLSRSAYLLQQGKFVADVIYYYGDDNNITALFGKKLPDVPQGYNYDFVNSDALIHMLSVKDGKIVTATGMSYRLLVLDSNARKMSLPVLRKLQELVKAGATVSGVMPESTPSEADDHAAFTSIVNEIWHTGNARVFVNKPLSEVLPALNIMPDFSYTSPSAAANLLYVHRKTDDRDIYWVNNREDAAKEVTATFRVTGKMPEVWHPETAKTEPVSYTIADGVTKVDLHLDPSDAVFVIFKKDAVNASIKLPAETTSALATLGGEWRIAFQADRGAPASVTVNDLKSWTESADAGVKYFSGTAAYTKTIDAPALWFKKGARLWLDMGDVKNIAEVIINGKPAGIVWKKPFRADVTGYLKPGSNSIEIKVTNLWVNRLIGDTQPGATKKYTYTTMPFYQANSPLQPSGLIGPVKIVAIE